MSTEELVDELVQRFNGWNRSGEHGVLRYLNSAHEILMSADSQQTTIFDTSTGKLPILSTTAGVFNYTMADTVRRVGGILVEVEKIGFIPFDYGWKNFIGRISYKNNLVIAGIRYMKLPFIRTKDRVNSTTPASVMFSKDPLTKNDYYRLLSYRVPVQILSENIQVEVPAPWDFDLLLPATAKLIEGVQSGNYDEARRIVRMELKPLLWKELDAGDQGDLDMEAVNRGY